ncbi:MAG: SCO family protein [Bacteroidota bacterium]
MKNLLWLGLLILAIGIGACDESPQQEELPIMGQPSIVDGDTIPFALPAFSLMNQDSTVINNESLKGKVFVSDFFFTSCPTICPRMKAQMLRIQKEFMDDDRVVLVSHTIDPRFDQVPVLSVYADRLGIDSEKWHLLTGDKDEIYDLARSYMITALEDSTAPGGYAHSGAFILVDQKQHIRGFYDGTIPDDVDNLMGDILTLLD